MNFLLLLLFFFFSGSLAYPRYSEDTRRFGYAPAPSEESSEDVFDQVDEGSRHRVANFIQDLAKKDDAELVDYFDTEHKSDPDNRKSSAVGVKAGARVAAQATKAVAKAGGNALKRVRRTFNAFRGSNPNNFPRAKQFIGKTAEVVEKDASGAVKVRKFYQFADTEKGKGLMYHVENVLEGNVQEGFTQMETNPLDQTMYDDNEGTA
ncbi:unnamed protein product [Caenorhabditis sp. 36 PRJEB53466]|nr:unnamed protein product [Caenorhabditis sp. 36 PRJEB53466]